ncbi:MAG TPA: sigma-70 family RNA polymerase sigma factor [Bacteroidetes bacterium]|nr:sigma-70 family RNA polymerase sigma factor [Bacteroidota bacterium]
MTRAEFKQLFDQYFDAVRNYIWYRSGNPELASDVAQEAFLKLWEKRPYADKTHLKGLLFKMAGDIFISNYRKQKSELKFRAAIDNGWEHLTPEETFYYKELKVKYEKALAKMPENNRTVFLMNRMDRMKYKEIAEVTGIGIKAVEKRMSQALKLLKQEIQNKSEKDTSYG